MTSIKDISELLKNWLYEILAVVLPGAIVIEILRLAYAPAKDWLSGEVAFTAGSLAVGVVLQGLGNGLGRAFPPRRQATRLDARAALKKKALEKLGLDQSLNDDAALAACLSAVDAKRAPYDNLVARRDMARGIWLASITGLAVLALAGLAAGGKMTDNPPGTGATPAKAVEVAAAAQVTSAQPAPGTGGTSPAGAEQPAAQNGASAKPDAAAPSAPVQAAKGSDAGNTSTASGTAPAAHLIAGKGASISATATPGGGTSITINFLAPGSGSSPASPAASSSSDASAGKTSGGQANITKTMASSGDGKDSSAGAKDKSATSPTNAGPKDASPIDPRVTWVLAFFGLLLATVGARYRHSQFVDLAEIAAYSLVVGIPSPSTSTGTGTSQSGS